MNMIAKAFSEGVKQALKLLQGAINTQTVAKAAEKDMKNTEKAAKAAAKAAR